MEQRDRLLESLAQGMRWLVEPEPPEVDRTPREEVGSFGKVRVLRFQGGPRTRATPVLLVPALMVKPYLYDLRPGHSLAAWLMERGYDVFVVDFGTPDEADAHLRIEDYVFSYLPTAADLVRRSSGREGLTLLGYCMGGLFSLLATAELPAVRNLVLVACPVDYEKMGLISYVTRRYHRQLLALLDHMGNVPGFVPTLAVEMSDPMGSLARFSDSFLSIWDGQYRKGHEALNHWLHDLVPGPRDTWKEFLETFMVGNALVEGQVTLGDRTLTLDRVACPVLALAGQRDPIATVESTREIVDLVASPDRTWQVVPGGHVGLIAGSRAPGTTWSLIGEWLDPRS